MPSLYKPAPTLQAVAIMPSGQTDTTFWQSLQRTVPIVTPDDLDEEAAHDLSAFAESLQREPDIITLLNASGRCIWTSVELDDSGSDLASKLRHALQQALPREREEKDDVMDLG